MSEKVDIPSEDGSPKDRPLKEEELPNEAEPTIPEPENKKAPAPREASPPPVIQGGEGTPSAESEKDVPDKEQPEKPTPLGSVIKGIKNLFQKGEDRSFVVKVAKKMVDDRKEMIEGLKLESLIDLNDRHVRVEIFLNEETSEYIYHSIEPSLAPRQQKVREFLIETLGKSLAYDKEAMETAESKEKYLHEAVEQIGKDYRSTLGELTEDFMDPILYFIRREYIGYGKINSIMMDPGVEDISCDGTGIPVFVYHRDYGSIRTTISFDTDEELEGFVVSLSQRAGKNISVADPILDATLPEGHRLNATFGREVTTRGSSFTIRKFKEDPLTISDLVNFGTISSEMAAHFWMAVQYGESMIFAGGTASGKTATMNAISIYIPTSAKIISIEDTREVNLPHQNWIAGITRGSADSEKSGDIDMYQLLRAALRQRPEYVLVGEVRGKETMTMFQAMATGHVTYSTMHADSVKSIVYRLENPPISIPRVLIQALNLVVIHNQLRVKGKRVRRITELVEIVGIEPTSLEIITNRVYKWEPAGDTFVFGGHSNLYEKIMDQEDMTRDEVVIELNRRAELIDWLVKNNVRQFKDVNTVVSEYYEDADKVIKLIRENPVIDIEDGLHVFDELLKERLPPSTQEALPGITETLGTGSGGA
ncbi:MAG: type II/IV secretion system ATPase subunit [Candidatus Thermoplasmatota archaeon]|nr:type II/IV secretion system ATPase subunit [Candidatus Thermoplasmatota archaeon]